MAVPPRSALRLAASVAVICEPSQPTGTEEPPPIGVQTLTPATPSGVMCKRSHITATRFVRSQTIGRTSHSQCTSIEDVRVDHRCADIGMAKELLDCANFVPEIHCEVPPLGRRRVSESRHVFVGVWEWI
jgi:hypothetical protein